MTQRAHPDQGVLRRLLDEPDGVSDIDRAHVDGCDACRIAMDEVRRDADVVRALLADILDDLDVDAAWQRLSATPDAGSNVVPVRPRLRSARRRPVAAALVVGAVLAGGGVAAANDWIPVFRTEHVSPVDFDIDALSALPDLASYGDVSLEGEPGLRDAADAADAEALTGLDAPVVDELPRGIDSTPGYRVAEELRATFTYDADRAGDTSPPAGLDGSTFRLTAGPGVAVIWPTSSGAPGLLVARAMAPRADSTSGLPFDVLRDHLVSLPGFPERIADSLRSFNADGRTLPLPAPASRVRTRPVVVGGVEATLLESLDGAMTGVVWVEDGVVTVVAGALGRDEIFDISTAVR